MRLMIFAAGAALTLTACGGNRNEQNAEANMSADNNMMMTDPNLVMDANMSGDANAMGGAGTTNAGGMDGNAATENAMMQKDLNTNDRDTNLANGM